MLETMLTYAKARFGLATSEDGATAVEYGIMVALIAIVIIVAVIFLGEALRDVFSKVGTEIEGAGN